MGDRCFDAVYRAVYLNKLIPREIAGKRVDVTAENRILLRLLRIVSAEDFVMVREEARYRRFIKAVKAVANVLKGLSYALVKLWKSAIYVPADIDITIERRRVGEAVSRNNVEVYIGTAFRRDGILHRFLKAIDIGLKDYLRSGSLMEERYFHFSQNSGFKCYNYQYRFVPT